LANKALGQLTWQSTDTGNPLQPSSHAVDGSVDGRHCSIVASMDADPPWWAVDLTGHYRVAEVNVLPGRMIRKYTQQ